MSYRTRRGMGAMDKGTAQDIQTGVSIASGIAQGIAQTVASAQQSSSSTPFPDTTPIPTTTSSGPSTDWTPWIIGGGVVATAVIGLLFLRPPRGVSANRRRRSSRRRTLRTNAKRELMRFRSKREADAHAREAKASYAVMARRGYATPKWKVVPTGDSREPYAFVVEHAAKKVRRNGKDREAALDMAYEQGFQLGVEAFANGVSRSALPSWKQGRLVKFHGAGGAGSHALSPRARQWVKKLGVDAEYDLAYVDGVKDGYASASASAAGRGEWKRDIAAARRSVQPNRKRRRTGQSPRYEVVTAQRVIGRRTSKKAARKLALLQLQKAPHRQVQLLDRGRPVKI